MQKETWYNSTLSLSEFKKVPDLLKFSPMSPCTNRHILPAGLTQRGILSSLESWIGVSPRPHGEDGS